MKISLDWIADFVDLADVAPETIADRLTLATAEVEGWETVDRAVAGVVVGEVVSVEPMGGASGSGDDDAGKLQWATVACGRRQYRTVCGAPNLRLGMKAPFAPPGVRLASGVRIEAAEVAGRPSEGVLCSPRELGMSHWHDGLLACPETLPAGAPLAEYVPQRDVVLVIDNKSLTHRPDLWGHYAFARELAAVFRRPLKPLPQVDLARFDHLPAYPLTVEDPEGCPCYGCIEFQVAAAVPSPLVIQRRLHAVGQRTYNLLVDLTNYVMLELAQPTHAFDGDRVRAIRVAPMGCHGPFTTLDGQERALVPEDLLIWNEKEPVALAGVMGGLNSEVESTTTKVLLESANFRGSRVRRTSVRLDLRTESAQRFEKNQPPANVKLAAARILHLVAEAGVAHQVTSRFTVAGDLKESYRPIQLEPGQLAAMAGTEIPQQEVVSILHRLGFQAEYAGQGRLEVGIPPHRSQQDIAIPADIAEEVLRVYGYDRIEPRLPEAPLEPVYVNQPLRTEHRARRLLAAAHGFVEVHNYAWMDDAWLRAIAYRPEGALELANPSTQQTRRLRTSLVPNLLALVPKNRAHQDRFRLFEVGDVYCQGKDGGVIESVWLAGVSYAPAAHPPREEHFRQIKGVMEDLGRLAGGEPLRFQPSGAGGPPWQVPGRWVAICRGDQQLGGLGLLDGRPLKAVAPEGGEVVWFELALGPLAGPDFPAVRYKAPPVYPGSWQDFSLVWEVAQGFAALENRLARFSHPLVMRRDFLYAYQGKGLPAGQASYSFRYWLGAWDHTLTSHEIGGFREAFLKFLDAEGIALRAAPGPPSASTPKR